MDACYKVTHKVLLNVTHACYWECHLCAMSEWQVKKLSLIIFCNTERKYKHQLMIGGGGGQKGVYNRQQKKSKLMTILIEKLIQRCSLPLTYKCIVDKHSTLYKHQCYSVCSSHQKSHKSSATAESGSMQTLQQFLTETLIHPEIGA